MKYKKLIRVILSIVLWLGIWEIISVAVNKTLLIPRPDQVFLRLIEMTGDAGFWLSIFLSCIRVLIGFSIGTLVGFLFGISMEFFPVSKILIQPFVTILRTTPVVSFIILALVWLNSNVIPPLIACIMVLPIVCQNIQTGVSHTSKEYLEMGFVFRLSQNMIFRKIYLPSLKPYFISASITSFGNAWKAGIAAEVLCLPQYAIGSGLYRSKIYLETADLFSWTIVILILSFAGEFLFRKLFREKKIKKADDIHD